MTALGNKPDIAGVESGLRTHLVAIAGWLAGCGGIAGDSGSSEQDAAVASPGDSGPRSPRPDGGQPAEPEPDAASPELVGFTDTLRNQTTGTLLGGQITPTGWRVTARTDRIYWTLPPLSQGAIEFTVTGLRNGAGSNMGLASIELLTMYDAGYGSTEPVSYFNTFRNNYHKVTMRVAGTTQADSGKQMLIWQQCPAGSPGFDDEGTGCPCTNRFARSDTGGNTTWDGTAERIRVEWNASSGSRLLRNGAEIVAYSWDDTRAYAPSELHFSLGTARAQDINDAGLPVGIVFSDLVVDAMTGSPAIDCVP